MDIGDLTILFWGTSSFAVPLLEALIHARFGVVGVVTNPDEPAGRKKIITPSPVKRAAERLGLPVFQPENLKDKKEWEALPAADLYIVAAYGKIIPRELILRPSRGILNVHPSLLPRWRGPSPMQFTILSGDKEAGVSIMIVDELMDHGPIIAQKTLEIGTPHYRQLHDLLAKEGAQLLVETLPAWMEGKVTLLLQDDAKATYSKLLKKDDGRIMWKKSAQEIERMVRAFNPWPGTWTLWPHDSKIYRVKIETADAIDEMPPEGSPGYLWQNKERKLCVKTGVGSLVIKTLTFEGKKAMAAEDFRHGHPNIVETTFV